MFYIISILQHSSTNQKQMFMLVGGLLLFSFQFNPTNFQLYNFHLFQYPFFQHFKGIYPCVRSQYSIRMVVQLQDEILYHIIKSRGKIEAARTNRQPSSPTLHRKLSLVRDQSEKCVLVHLKGSFLISGGRKWVPYISE